MRTDDAARLAMAISALLEHFKMGAEGTAHDGMPLIDTAIVGRITSAVERDQEVIQKDISDALRLPKTTMASAVKRLVARRLVRRTAGDDPRAKVLGLTEEGAAFAKALRRAQIAASASMLESLPGRDRKRLLELLERIASQMPKTDRLVDYCDLRTLFMRCSYQYPLEGNRREVNHVARSACWAFGCVRCLVGIVNDPRPEGARANRRIRALVADLGSLCADSAFRGLPEGKGPDTCRDWHKRPDRPLGQPGAHPQRSSCERRVGAGGDHAERSLGWQHATRTHRAVRLRGRRVLGPTGLLAKEAHGL